MKKYYPGLDICKFIFSILVVCIHTNPFIDYSIPINLIVSGMLSTFAVPYFFVVSGFLSSSRSLKKSVKRPMILWGIWAGIYFLFIHGWKLGFSQLLKLVFISGGYFHLWYMPVLVHSLIICKAILDKIPRKFAVALCISFYICGVLLYTYLGGGSEISRVFFRFLSIGIPFVYFGMMCGNPAVCRWSTIKKWRYMFIVLWICESLLLSYMGSKNGYTLLFSSFPIVALIFRYSCLYQNERGNMAIKRIGRLSGSLYYIHPMVMQLIENFLIRIGVRSINSFLFFLFVLFISLCSCWLIESMNNITKREKA